MSPANDSDARRTTALAYWRYGHEYLRAARALCGRHRLLAAEVQPTYHLTAQALEFALKAFLRARGVSAADVLHYGRALQRAFDDAIARGLPSPPAEVAAAVRLLADHHRASGFVAIHEEPNAFADLTPLFDAVHWLLDSIVPVVAEDYTAHYAEAATPSKESFVARLRADLAASLSADAVPA